MTAHELVAKARNLPPVSEAALKLIGLLGRPETANDEIVGLLRSDSLLTARLLRACNSPAFGLDEPVTSVDQAVFLLGYKQIHSLVLSLAFGSTLATPLPAYAIKANGLWRHALLTATATEAAVKRGLNPAVDPSIAFTVGLLHDIGKLVMAQALTRETEAAIRNHMAGEGLGSVEAEREVLGTDHAEVGSCLLYIWRLPDLIVEAAANHHRPVVQPTPRLSAIAHLANRVAHLADDEAAPRTYAFNAEEPVVQAFEFSPTDQANLIADLRNAAEKVKGLMAVV